MMRTMEKRTSSLLAERKGFTLIEVLIVIAISALLSTIVITYSSVSKNEIAVSVEAAKISQTIFQAKTLAISTYANSSSSCGYGVSFNYASGTYSIFAYDPSGYSSCPSANTVASKIKQSGDNISSFGKMVEYSDATWNVPIGSGVLLQKQLNSVILILFYPPDPTTFISRDGDYFTSADPSLIYLAAVGNTPDVETISVDSSGQVTL